MFLTWGLQLYSYWGILEQAANQTQTTKTKATTAKNKSKELVGGENLDLLALTIVIQYLTVLWSSKWFLMLLGVPVYAGWSLYRTIYGVPASASNTSSAGGKLPVGSSRSAYPTTVDASDIDEEGESDKREKRAKGRRQRKFA
jgi:hypothetical protein